MKKAKFVSRDERQRQFVAALQANVKEYFKTKGISTKGNYSVGLQTATMLSLYLLPLILLLCVPVSGWVAAPLAILAGIGLAGIGMCVMHGAAHGAFSNRDWVNQLFGRTMYLLGNSVFTWKVQHNMLHHTYTNITGLDRDIETKGPIRLSEHAPLRKIHSFQHIHAFPLYGFMTFSLLVKDFSQLFEYHRNGHTAKQNVKLGRELTKMILLKVFHLSLFVGLPILFSGFLWWQVLIGFVLMHLTAGFIMSVVFQLAHVVEGVDQPMPNADGVIESDWIVHELHTTANFAQRSPLLGWYIGGLNFQIEHHLFPHICHIHYPKIAPIVERTAKEYGYPYHCTGNFFQALGSHVRRLRALGSGSPQLTPSQA